MQHKKQLFTIFEGIAEINNNVWGNPKGSYDDAKEAAYQIEEALEGGNTLEHLMRLVTIGSDENAYIGDDPETIANLIVEAGYDAELAPCMSDVDRFDKALDAIYFAVGSMHKLGLTPAQMVDGLQVVHNANLQKTGAKDSKGKVSKPDNFVPPESLLQSILDRRVTLQ